MSKIFTLDRTWRVFFRIGFSGHFIAMIGLWFQRHNHIRMFQNHLGPFQYSDTLNNFSFKRFLHCFKVFIDCERAGDSGLSSSLPCSWPSVNHLSTFCVFVKCYNQLFKCVREKIQNWIDDTLRGRNMWTSENTLTSFSNLVMNKTSKCAV